MPRDLFAQPLFSPKLIKARFSVQPLPSAHEAATKRAIDTVVCGLLGLNAAEIALIERAVKR